MAAKDRIRAIKQIVADDKKVTVSNLSEVFQVTKGTICRDLEKLEDKGFLTRTCGDTVLNTAMLIESIHFYERVSLFYEEKQLVARKALPFIDNKTTMITDSGSTVTGLLKLLQDRSDLTSLTNSAEAIHVLAQPETRVISAGGELSKNIFSLQGRIAKGIISRCHANTMVMSCEGLNINNGTLGSSKTEAEIEKTTTRQVTEVALLADHSKSDRKAFVQLADFSHINHITTDGSPGVERIAFCRDSNIQLMW